MRKVIIRAVAINLVVTKGANWRDAVHSGAAEPTVQKRSFSKENLL